MGKWAISYLGNMTSIPSRDFWRNHLQSNLPVLDAGTRIWEIVCGLIMVLTFTGSISAANADREDIRLILWAALGCNTAWGLVDALMYLMSAWMERSQGLEALNRARGAKPAEASAAIKEYLPPIIARVIHENHLVELRNELVKLPVPPSRPYLVGADLRNALMVFLLVFFVNFPGCHSFPF